MYVVFQTSEWISRDSVGTLSRNTSVQKKSERIINVMIYLMNNIFLSDFI